MTNRRKAKDAEPPEGTPPVPEDAPARTDSDAPPAPGADLDGDDGE